MFAGCNVSLYALVQQGLILLPIAQREKELQPHKQRSQDQTLQADRKLAKPSGQP